MALPCILESRQEVPDWTQMVYWYPGLVAAVLGNEQPCGRYG